MSEKPVPHDGQGDAMPCQCPACASPFVPQRFVGVDAGATPASIVVHAPPLMAFDPETGGEVPLAGVISFKGRGR
jgi:hypothetical protein